MPKPKHATAPVRAVNRAQRILARGGRAQAIQRALFRTPASAEQPKAKRSTR